jgi:hypothetical protein
MLVSLSGQSQTVNMGRTYVSSQNVRYANNGTTGTTLNKLAKLTGAPSTAILTATADTSGIVGIVVAGAGTTGSADIAFKGKALCVFDSATTAGHYVTNDTSTAGDCMDAGAAYPTSGQVIGVVTSTNGGAGTYEVDLTLGQAQANMSPFPTTPYEDAGFTWENQGPTSYNIKGSGVYVDNGSNSDLNLHLRHKAKTGPYKITALIIPNNPVRNFPTDMGIGWRESSTGKMVTLGLKNQEYIVSYLESWKWESSTSYDAPTASDYFLYIDVNYSQLFLQLEVDSTYRYMRFSYDGLHFITVSSMLKNDFILPDQVFYYIRAGGGLRWQNFGMYIASWKEE